MRLEALAALLRRHATTQRPRPLPYWQDRIQVWIHHINDERKPMQQTGLSDREREVLASTVRELINRTPEQLAYAIGATDALDGYGDAHIMREVEASEECQRLAGLLTLSLETWKTIVAPDPAIPHAGMRAAIELAMQSLAPALDAACASAPLPGDMAWRLNGLLDELAAMHSDLTEGDDDDEQP
jgi:hypothetical protein